MIRKMYDLENEILECRGVCEDIKLVYSQVGGDGLEDPTTDQLMNVLIGIEQLYDWRFEKLLSAYSDSWSEVVSFYKDLESEEKKNG
jgi:hypothetical protein